MQKENPYQVPATSEVNIYTQLKQSRINTIHEDALE